MKIKLTREISTDTFTQGRLEVDGVFQCWTLEDRERELGANCEGKVHGQTAIPKGTYSVILSFSNRFQKYMPEILNVPCFTGIRMHAGNKVDDTDGCVLCGMEKTAGGQVLQSKVAFAALMKALKRIEKKEKITIEIA